MTMAQLLGRRQVWHPWVGFDRCPRCRQEFEGLRLHDELWLETAIDDEWVAAMRLGIDDGHPVVTELRIFPNEPGRREAGKWSVERLGPEAQVPRGGLTTRKARQVKISEPLRDVLPELMAQWSHLLRAGLPKDFGGPAPMTPRGIEGAARRGPRRARSISDRELAEVARDYVEAVNDPATARSPRVAVAKRRGTSPERIRDLIFAARERDLLTTAGWGKSGGALTQDAIELLESEGGDGE